MEPDEFLLFKIPDRKNAEQWTTGNPEGSLWHLDVELYLPLTSQFVDTIRTLVRP